ncbi:MAG: protein kinase [Christensenella sp.]|nr:protein kinase [Christensenella sp.]
MNNETEFDAIFAFDEARYPAAFFADYEALACLAEHENTETLLVLERNTNVHRLAKCYLGESRSSGTTEAMLLKKLNDPGIPRYIAEYQNEIMLCVVREFIDGLPLNEYVAEVHPSPEQSVAIASQICDILAYLHRLSPPVIHRDIKPQNIIIDSGEKVWLIDFGISREYDASASKDTSYFGTADFAPPEQYGFSQTDNRTDIFSLGVLIGWLLTGESQPRRALPKLESTRLKKIVQTCTELTPDRRYASADKVKKALQHADGRIRRRLLRVVSFVIASFACLSAGFAVGRYTDYAPRLLNPSGVTFQEPLIEQAVRLSLGKSADDPISQEDLLGVNTLYIFGDQALGSAEAYSREQQRMGDGEGTHKNGGIRSLKDLAQLSRLTTIRIALQDIVDLSDLAGLTSLEIIDLNHNPIESVAPLSGLDSLKQLSVFDSRVSDFSALSSCRLLEVIEAGKTRVTSFSAFAGIGSLREVMLRNTTLDNLNGIESLTGLERVALGIVRSRDLTPLTLLPLLKEADLSEDLRADAARDLPDATFQIIFS